jgi:uncharacterized protein (TIGR02611 family)
MAMLRPLRRIGVAVVGGSVVAAGVAMIVLPGPAVLVIPAGLAILATEFRWAGRVLDRVRKPVERGLTLVGRRPEKPSDEAAKPPSRWKAS